MEQHRQLHFNPKNKFRCEDCDKGFASKLCWKQHMGGAHGSGYVTSCGQAFKWPDQRQKHVLNCEECIASKTQEDNKLKPECEPYTRRKRQSSTGIKKRT